MSAHAQKTSTTTTAIQAQQQADVQRKGQDMAPRTAPLSVVHNVQRSADQTASLAKGNAPMQIVSRKAAPTVQPKVTVGPANDQYEQEADRVADQVMSMPPQKTSVGDSSGAGSSVQRAPLAASITPLQTTSSQDIGTADTIAKQGDPSVTTTRAAAVQMLPEEQLPHGNKGSPVGNFSESTSSGKTAEPGGSAIQRSLGASWIQRGASYKSSGCDSCADEQSVQRKSSGPSYSIQRAGGARAGDPSNTIQRACSACSAREPPVQRACDCHGEAAHETTGSAVQPKPGGIVMRDGEGGGEASSNFESSLEASKGGGEPMSADTQSDMEGRFGADFSDVRIHDNAESAQMSSDIGARAFTHGSDVYFNSGEYQPESSGGKHLLAHELTHTVQQGGADVQTKPNLIQTSRGPPVVQRGLWDSFVDGVSAVGSAVVSGGAAILDTVLGWIQPRVANIPGYTMMTVLVGQDPITRDPVERTPDNFIRGFLGMYPGGEMLYQKMNEHGAITEASEWIMEEVDKLDITWSGISSLFTRTLDQFTLAGAIEGNLRVIRNNFGPIFSRVVNFATQVGIKILEFIKNAILVPMAQLASETRGWPLFTVLLGKNPLTDEEVERSPTNLIGGFMTLVGEEEKWQQIQDSSVINSTFEWFEERLARLNITWPRIQGMFIEAWDRLGIEDLLTPLSTLNTIWDVFGGFIVEIITFAGEAAIKVLEFIFEGFMILSGPFGARIMETLKRSRRVFDKIWNDPMAFAMNLINAVKKGMNQFVENILVHLRDSLLDWLFGSVADMITMPDNFDLMGILDLGLQILGLTYDNFRTQLAERIGEENVARLETAFEFIRVLVTEGLAAAWEKILEFGTEIITGMIDGVKEMVIETIVKIGMQKLALLLAGPYGAVVEAIITTYNFISTLIERINQILDFVTGVLDAVEPIANGDLSAAADFVEASLQRGLSMLISFLAGIIGLGGIPAKVRDVILRIQAPVQRAIGAVIDWVINAGRAFLGMGGENDQNPADMTPDEKKAAAKADLEGRIREGMTGREIKAQFPRLKETYHLSDVRLEDTPTGVRVAYFASPATFTYFSAPGTAASHEASTENNIATSDPRATIKSVTSVSGLTTQRQILIAHFPDQASFIRGAHRTTQAALDKPGSITAEHEGTGSSHGRGSSGNQTGAMNVGKDEMKLLTGSSDRVSWQGGHLIAYNVLREESNRSSNLAPQNARFNSPTYYNVFERIVQMSAGKKEVSVSLTYRNDPLRVDQQTLVDHGLLQHIDLSKDWVLTFPRRIPHRWNATARTIDGSNLAQAQLAASTSTARAGRVTDVDPADFDSVTVAATGGSRRARNDGGFAVNITTGGSVNNGPGGDGAITSGGGTTLSIAGVQDPFAPPALKPRPAVSPKLKIGPVDDPYEREADRVADQVVADRGPVSTSSGGGEGVQRKPLVQSISAMPGAIQRSSYKGKGCDSCKEDSGIQRKAIQREAEGGSAEARAGPGFESQLNQSKGGGQPMEEGTRNQMENSFGADFSDVNIHTGSEAAQMSDDVGARAFTHGNDIYFNDGEYAPETESGKHLLAHELTHTVQQGGGGDTAQTKVQRAPKAEVTKPDETIDMINGQVTASEPMVAYLKSKGSKGDYVKVRFGSMGQDVMQLRVRNGKIYTAGKKPQGIGINVSALSPLKRLGLKPAVVIKVKANAISGYVTVLKDGALVTGHATLFNQLNSHAEQMGWKGIEALSSKVTNVVEAGGFRLEANAIPVKIGGFLSGTLTLKLHNTQLGFEADADVNVPLLKPGSKLHVSRKPGGKVFGTVKAGFAIARLDGEVDVKYENGLLDIEGNITYQDDHFNGTIKVMLTDYDKAINLAFDRMPPGQIAATADAVTKSNKPGARALAGYGTVDFEINEHIKGRVEVIVDGEGHLTVVGEWTPDSKIELFKEVKPKKKMKKHLFKAEYAYGIPLLASIGIGVSVDLVGDWGFGPGIIHGLRVAGVYSTNPRLNNNRWSIGGHLNISAFAEAGVDVFIYAFASLLGHDIKAGLNMEARAGIKGYLDAGVELGARPAAKKPTETEYYLKGTVLMAAEPYLRLGSAFKVELDSPWWSPVPDKEWKWPLGDMYFPLADNLGIAAEVDHVIGSGELPEVNFKPHSFDPEFFFESLTEDPDSMKGDDGDKEMDSEFKDKTHGAEGKKSKNKGSKNKKLRIDDKPSKAELAAYRDAIEDAKDVGKISGMIPLEGGMMSRYLKKMRAKRHIRQVKLFKAGGKRYFVYVATERTNNRQMKEPVHWYLSDTKGLETESASKLTASDVKARIEKLKQIEKQYLDQNKSTNPGVIFARQTEFIKGAFEARNKEIIVIVKRSSGRWIYHLMPFQLDFSFTKGMIKKPLPKLRKQVTGAKLPSWNNLLDPKVVNKKFKDASGDPHTIYYKMKGRRVDMQMASENPGDIEPKIDKELKGPAAGTPAEQAILRQAKKQVAKAEARINSAITGPEPVDSQATQTVINAGTEGAEIATTLMVNGKYGDEPKIKLPEKAEYRNGDRTHPKWSKVDLITEDNQQAGSDTSGAPNGYALLSKYKLTDLSKQAWVRVHMISKAIGGKGTPINCFPGPQSLNLGGPSKWRQFEKKYYKLIEKERDVQVGTEKLKTKNVVWIDTKVSSYYSPGSLTHPPSDPADRAAVTKHSFVRRISFGAGEYDYDVETQTWKKNRTPTLSYESATVPQPKFGVAYIPSVNTTDRRGIMAVAGTSRDFTQKFVTMRGERQSAFTAKGQIRPAMEIYWDKLGVNRGKPFDNNMKKLEAALPPPKKGSKLKFKLIQKSAQQNDPLERQADHVADQVVGAPKGESAFGTRPVPVSAAQGIQQSGGESSSGAESAVSESLSKQSGGGKALDEGTKSHMEGSMGADFGGVRVHDGPEAAAMNDQMGSRAFTHGNDIYFNEGEYDPGSTEGQHLLAHELTHTVQQGASDTVRAKPADTAGPRSERDPVAGAAEPPKGKALDLSFAPASVQVVSPLPEETPDPEPPKPKAVEAKVQSGAAPPADDEGGDKKTAKGKGQGAPEKGGEKKEKKKQGKKQAKAPASSEGMVIAFTNAPATQMAIGLPGLGAAVEGSLKKERQNTQNKAPPLHADNSGKTAAQDAKSKAGEKASEAQLRDGVTEADGSKRTLQRHRNLGPAPNPKQNDHLLDQQKSGWFFSWFRDRFGGYMGGVATNDNGVNTNGGKVPNVDQRGKGNPNRTKQQRGDGDLQAGAKKAALDKAIKANPGKKKIQPIAVKETHKLVVEPSQSEIKTKAGQDMKDYVGMRLTSQERTATDAAMKPILEKSVAKKRKEIAAGAKKRDAGKKAAVADAQRQTKEANKKASDKQKNTIKTSRESVATQQRQGVAASKKLLGKYEKACNKKQKKVDKKVKGKIKAANKKSKKEIGKGERKAKAKKKAAEKKAATKKRKLKKKSKKKSWWEKAVDAVKSAVKALTNAITAIFDALRKAVTAIINAAKDLALAAIELARTAIIAALDAFGTFLKGMVNKYLKEHFPGLAKKINKGIDATVGAAKKAVNAAADGLKKAVTFIADNLNKAVNKILGVFEAVIVGGIQIMGALVTGDFAEAARVAIRTGCKIAGVNPKVVFDFIDKAKGTMNLILKKPLQFFNNAAKAAGKGFSLFKKNVMSHLAKGVITWLTGAMAPVTISMPKKLDAPGIFSMSMQLLGLTPDSFKEKVKAKMGPKADKIWPVAEKGLGLLKKVANKGIGALHETVKGEWKNIKETAKNKVLGAISTEVIKAGIFHLLAMLNPASALVKGVIMIVKFIFWVTENKDRIVAFVVKFYNSVDMMARGKIDPAAKAMEKVLGATVPLFLGAMASLLNLDGIGKAVQKAIQAITAPINKVIEGVINWVVKQAQKLWGKAKSGAKKLKNKVFSLLGIKKKFKFKNGEKHTIFFKKVGKRMVPYMASGDPQTIDTLVNAVPNGVAKVALRAKNGELQKLVKESESPAVSNDSTKQSMIKRKIEAAIDELIPAIQGAMGKSFTAKASNSIVKLFDLSKDFEKQGGDFRDAQGGKKHKLGVVANIPMYHGDAGKAVQAKNRYVEAFKGIEGDHKKMAQERLGMVFGLNAWDDVAGNSPIENKNAAKIKASFSKINFGGGDPIGGKIGFLWGVNWHVNGIQTSVADMRKIYQASDPNQKKMIELVEKRIDKNKLPFGLFRDTIKNHPYTKRYIGNLIGHNCERVYLSLNDPDIRGLVSETPSDGIKNLAQIEGSLDKAAKGMIAKLESEVSSMEDQGEAVPEILAGGYKLDLRMDFENNERVKLGSEKKIATYLASRIDMAVRKAMARLKPSSIYFPEPNTYVLAKDLKGVKEQVFTASFGAGFSRTDGMRFVRNLMRQKGYKAHFLDYDMLTTPPYRFAMNEAVGKLYQVGIKIEGGQFKGILKPDVKFIRKLMGQSQSHVTAEKWTQRVTESFGYTKKNNIQLFNLIMKIRDEVFGSFYEVIPKSLSKPGITNKAMRQHFTVGGTLKARRQTSDEQAAQTLVSELRKVVAGTVTDAKYNAWLGAIAGKNSETLEQVVTRLKGKEGYDSLVSDVKAQVPDLARASLRVLVDILAGLVDRGPALG